MRIFGFNVEDGAIRLIAQTVPTRIQLLFRIGFDQSLAGITVDNHTLVFDQ